MGVDIHIYAETKINGKWLFCMPGKTLERMDDFEEYCPPFDVGGRNLYLFQVLSGYYKDGHFGDDFKSISPARGLPVDLCPATSELLEDLIAYSYLTLKEINDFDWTAEAEDNRTYSELVLDEFSKVLEYLQSLVTESVTENDVRIVFGYSV